MMTTTSTVTEVIIQMPIAKLTCKPFVVANIKASSLGSFILRVSSRLFVFVIPSTEPEEEKLDPSKSMPQNLRYI